MTKEICQWHIYAVGEEKCPEVAYISTTNKRTLEIGYLCREHFEKLVAEGKIEKKKAS
jgi:hypothetical protein